VLAAAPDMRGRGSRRYTSTASRRSRLAHEREESEAVEAGKHVLPRALAQTLE
jgi:hypothetical protein